MCNGNSTSVTVIIFYSLINGIVLVAGAIVGVFFRFSRKTIAAITAFGSGVLMCALSFGLMEEAFYHGGFGAVIIGFLVGGLLFIGGSSFVYRYGGRSHRRHVHHKASRRNISGSMIVLGSVLDGIPESVALGVGFSLSPRVGLMMLIAIILSNFPESIAATAGLKKEGFRTMTMIGIWVIVGAAVMATTLLSYVFLSGLPLSSVGVLEAFAAGAILAMLADNMMPEAYHGGGFMAGFFTVLGFLVAFIVSHIS